MSVKFEYFDAKTVKEAVSLLEKYGEEAKIIAGGTDLLVNIREAVTPRYVINIKNIPNLSYINHEGGNGLNIGPLTLLHDIEVSSEIREKYDILANAAHQVGSLQIRYMGTLGGNLCQDRKCLYYNQSHVNLFMRQSIAPCWVRGGSVCHTIGKDNIYQALIGGKKCWAPCPSDLAITLVSLDATVKIVGPNGEKILPVEQFFTDAGETVLKFNELLTEVKVSPQPDGGGSVFLKYKRGSRDFAIASVAVSMKIDRNGVCEEARIVLGGVSPLPLRSEESEAAVRGKKLEDSVIEDASQAALKNARAWGPATDFKIVKARRLIGDALRTLRKG